MCDPLVLVLRGGRVAVPCCKTGVRGGWVRFPDVFGDLAGIAVCRLYWGSGARGDSLAPKGASPQGAFSYLSGFVGLPNRSWFPMLQSGAPP